MQETKVKAAINSIVESVIKNEPLFTNPSVDNGKMGLAIFYFYLFKFENNTLYYEKGVQLIRESINALSQVSQSHYYEPTYYGDSVLNVISSFGKGLIFLEKRFALDFDFGNYYKQLDEVLYAGVKSLLAKKNLDYFNGVLAPGYYFLNRFYHYKDPFAKMVLTEIFEEIKNCSVRNNDFGIYWPSTFLKNAVYLGISHGSSMIINFVSKLFDLGVLGSATEKLILRKAVDFVMSNYRPIKKIGYFPDLYFSDFCEYKKTQFAMCYGDLGVLYALRNAASVLSDDTLRSTVENMIYSFEGDQLDRKRTYDAGLLYGCSGVYGIFRDFAEKWGLKSLKKTSHYWYDEILGFRDGSDNDIAGFYDAYKDVENDPNVTAKYSFLWGIIGVGITLIVGLDDKLPKTNEITLIGI